LHNISKVADV